MCSSDLGAKWFAGKVLAVNRDGSYDIRYDDGDIERDVVASHVRSLGGSASPVKESSSSDRIIVGDKIEARYKGGAKWFAGKVLAVNRDGSYDIRYDDGDIERDVVASRVRSLGESISPVNSPSPHQINVGDKVEVRYGMKWHSARVLSVNRDRSYGILYDDGDVESDVFAVNVRSFVEH